jgi:restriction system protein
MAATHTPPRRARKTATRRRTRRLPRLGWGWAILALTLLGVAKTWPLYTALTVALIAVTVILAVVRPRRLTPLLNRADAIAAAVTARRSHLPAPGRRTLTAFHRMQPYQFERAIAALATEHPTVAHAQQVGQANDRGADVLVTLKDGRRILLQCKHHEPGNNVSSPVVQTINGVYRDIHHCYAAAIVTTAGFTRAAYETSSMLPTPIRLIDGPALTAWANGGPTPWT